MSLPPLSVTVDQLPGKLPQLPPESATSSRCSTLVLESTPEPPSLPPFFVTGTERLVYQPAVTLGAVTAGAVVSATTVNGVAPDVSAQPFVAVTSWLPAGAVAAALNV